MSNLLKMIIVFSVVSVVGCGQNSSQVADSTDAVDRSFLLDSEPADSAPVGNARQSAQDGDTVTLVGNIGGSTEPFVDGVAAFTIVDPKVAYCPPEEGCPTPWDYCCTQAEVKENIATVKVVDSDGKVVGKDARTMLGVKELSTVVIEGTAKRDDEGNLAVLANKVFVKKQ